jgi:hypothetical protein
VDQIGTGGLTPLPLPGRFFLDSRENVQLALRPFVP